MHDFAFRPQDHPVTVEGTIPAGYWYAPEGHPTMRLGAIFNTPEQAAAAAERRGYPVQPFERSK